MRALELARAAVDSHNAANAGRGGIAAVARKIGYARPSLSLYLSGRYPAGDTGAIEAAIVRALTGRVSCPHLGRDLSADECLGFASRPMPMSRPDALRHWHACRDCPHSKGDADDQR